MTTSKLYQNAVLYLRENSTWYLRIWLKNQRRYIRLSLGTGVEREARELAEKRYLELTLAEAQGKHYFAKPVSAIFDLWMEERQKEVETKAITQQRICTIKSCMRVFLEKYGQHSITSLNKRCIYEWPLVRPKLKSESVSTEVKVIRSFIRWANNRGLCPIRDLEVMAYQQIHGRRETFGAEESEDLTEYAYGVWMGDNPRRMMLYGLISILYGTGMRVGEALQLKYDAVQHTDGVACEITIKPETTKVRKERKIIANVWDTIDWLYKKFGNDLFSHPSIKVVNASMVGHQFDVLLDDYNSSHPVNQISTDLTLYSFRHQFLTERAENPNINVLELAIYCGTSVDQLQKHYYHQTDKIKEKIALNLSSPLLR